MKNRLKFDSIFLLIFELILSVFWDATGRYFERILGARIDTKINGILEGFWEDSRSYVGQMPKATTLDLFENFRVDRRLRHLPRIIIFIGKC